MWAFKVGKDGEKLSVEERLRRDKELLKKLTAKARRQVDLEPSRALWGPGLSTIYLAVF